MLNLIKHKNPIEKAADALNMALKLSSEVQELGRRLIGPPGPVPTGSEAAFNGPAIGGCLGDLSRHAHAANEALVDASNELQRISNSLPEQRGGPAPDIAHCGY